MVSPKGKFPRKQLTGKKITASADHTLPACLVELCQAVPVRDSPNPTFSLLAPSKLIHSFSSWKSQVKCF